MDQAENLRNIIKVQNQQQKLARVITVTSGKGGVGKSNISVNLAIQLQRMGKKVIILDADFGLANVEVMLGIRPKYNLADMIYRGKDLMDIITEGPCNIEFISGGSGIQELVNLSKDQIRLLNQRLCEIDNYADVIIIDTGAGISDTVLEFLVSSSEILLVTTSEPTSITDAYALLKTLNQKEGFSNENTAVKMIANRVDTYEEGKELYNKLSIVVTKFLNIQLEYLGAAPQDNNVLKSVMQQKPISLVYPKSPFSKAVFELADFLYDNETGVQQSQRGISKLFNKIIRTKLFGR